MPAGSLHPTFLDSPELVKPMRAEMIAIVDETKQSLGLLRRHL
jgi:hypothetical protein